MRREVERAIAADVCYGPGVDTVLVRAGVRVRVRVSGVDTVRHLAC